MCKQEGDNSHLQSRFDCNWNLARVLRQYRRWLKRVGSINTGVETAVLAAAARDDRSYGRDKGHVRNEQHADHINDRNTPVTMTVIR